MFHWIFSQGDDRRNLECNLFSGDSPLKLEMALPVLTGPGLSNNLSVECQWQSHWSPPHHSSVKRDWRFHDPKMCQHWLHLVLRGTYCCKKSSGNHRKVGSWSYYLQHFTTTIYKDSLYQLIELPGGAGFFWSINGNPGKGWRALGG